MKDVILERVIFERSRDEIALIRKNGGDKFPSDTESVPDETGTKFMTDSALEELRMQKVPSCADVVVTSRRPDGTPVFLSSFRSNKGGGNIGFWWMQGGMLKAGQSILALLNDRLKKEGGLIARSFTLAGFYRTVSERGTFCDTIQPCYLAHVSWEDAEKATTDKDHSNVRFFSWDEFNALPRNEINWYPERVFKIAVETVPQ